jgi:hypothetical protein
MRAIAKEDFVAMVRNLNINDSSVLAHSVHLLHQVEETLTNVLKDMVTLDLID